MTNNRRRDPIATRNTILETAQRLFVAKGFAETSTSAVAREAGVTKSLIHHHFGSKKELWNAVKKRHFQAYFDAQSELLTQSDNTVEVLRQSLITYFQFLANHPDFVRLMCWMYLEEDDECDDMAHDLLSHGVKKIRESQELGFIRDDLEPGFILTSFLSLVEHWFLSKPHREAAIILDLEDPMIVPHLDKKYLEQMLKIYLEGVVPR